MLATIRTKVDQTKKFVQKHQTLTACAATALITWKITHDAAPTRDDFGKVIHQMLAYGEQNDLLALQNGVLLDFVNRNELADEVRAHIASLKD